MKEQILKKQRRYYYDFLCKKCKKKNKGYDTTDSKAGLVETGYGKNCFECGVLNIIVFKVRYFKTSVMEISKEEFLSK